MEIKRGNGTRHANTITEGLRRRGIFFFYQILFIFVSLLVSEISVQGAVEYDYSLHCWPQRSRNWLRALLKSTMVIVTVKQISLFSNGFENLKCQSSRHLRFWHKRVIYEATVMSSHKQMRKWSKRRNKRIYGMKRQTGCQVNTV